MANLKFKKIISFILLLIVAALMIGHGGMSSTEDYNYYEFTAVEINQDEYQPTEEIILDIGFTTEETGYYLNLSFDFYFIDSNGYQNSYSSKNNEYISNYFATNWTKDNITPIDSASYTTQAKFIISPDFCNGDFLLSITGGNTTQSINFKTIGQTQDCHDFLTEEIISPQVQTYTTRLGGHSNASLNSFLELDSGISLSKQNAMNNYSGVDLVYTFSATDSSPILISPSYATQESGLEFYQNWNSPTDTKFHLIDTTYTSLTTTPELQFLFDLEIANLNSGKVKMPLNGAVIVKSDLNKYFIVQLKSASIGSSGFAEFEVTH